MHVSEKEALGELVKKFKRPMRFLYTQPLQMVVELNPPTKVIVDRSNPFREKKGIDS